MRNDNTSIADTTTTMTSDSMDISFVNVPNVNDDSPALSISVMPKHGIVGMGSSMRTTQACVTMQARDLPEEEEDDARAPVDIIIALDVSYSMSGEKLELCKETLELLLKCLYPSDRFGLVSFSDNAMIEIPAQKMTDSNKKECLDKIKSLHVRGNTNISAAIGLAYQEMCTIKSPNPVRTVFLLTDGQANEGISDEEGLVQVTRNLFANDTNNILLGTEGAGEHATTQRRGFGFNFGEQSAKIARRSRFCFGRRSVTKPKEDKDAKPKSIAMNNENGLSNNQITLHCFGYGSDHNSELLRRMADVTPGGSYYFVKNDENVSTAFGDALGGIMSVVAQNVVVSITVPEEAKTLGVEIVDVYHDQKVKRENGSYSVVVGDFYAEECRDVLFEFKLATNVAAGADVTNHAATTGIPHASISVSYTDTLQKIPVSCNNVDGCLVARPMGTAEVSESNDHVEAQWLRIETVKAMAEANEMARNRNYSCAQNKVQYMKASIKKSKAVRGAKKEMLDELMADIDIVDRYCGTKSSYETMGAHMFSNLGDQHRKQRCMQSEANAPLSTYAGKEGKVRRAYRKKLAKN